MASCGQEYHLGYEVVEADQAAMREIAAEDRLAREALAVRRARRRDHLAAFIQALHPPRATRRPHVPTTAGAHS